MKHQHALGKEPSFLNIGPPALDLSKRAVDPLQSAILAALHEDLLTYEISLDDGQIVGMQMHDF